MKDDTKEVLDNPITKTVAFGLGLVIGYKMSPRSAAFTGGVLIGYIVGREATK